MSGQDDVIHTLRIADIIVRDRARQSYPEDDYQALVTSMGSVGQLDPIKVCQADDGIVLLDGETRMKVLRYLGQQSVKARFHPKEHAAQIEFDSNVCRVGFTLEERIALGKKKEAEVAGRHGSNQHGKNEEVQNFAPPAGKTRDLAAQAAGFDNHTSYEQGKKVVEQGVPELVAAVNNKQATVSAAALVAELPPEEQKAAVKGGKRGVAAAAKKVRQGKAKPKAPKKDKSMAAGHSAATSGENTDGLPPNSAAGATDLQQQVAAMQAELETARDLLFEQANVIRGLEAELEPLRAIACANDQLAAAHAQIEKYRQQMEAVENTNVGLANERNVMIGQINALKREKAKLEKELAKHGAAA